MGERLINTCTENHRFQIYPTFLSPDLYVLGNFQTTECCKNNSQYYQLSPMCSYANAVCG